MGRSPGWHIDRCPASPQEGCVAFPWANPKRRQLYHISGWATENASRQVFVSYLYFKTISVRAIPRPLPRINLQEGEAEFRTDATPFVALP